jgi:hypothetical protein
MSTMVRIAKVKATGSEYIVQQVQLSRDEDKEKSKVFCWGECVSFKGTGKKWTSKHEDTKCFMLDAVEIREVEGCYNLYDLLVAQRIRALRTRGHLVTVSRTGKTYTDHGKVR